MKRGNLLVAWIAVLLSGLVFVLAHTNSGFAETVYFYHNDHLGSPLAMTDMQGNVVWRRDYKPFGQEIDPGGATTVNTHKYTGKEFDTETGLYYYGARYYDPAIGRFISVDPVGGKPEMPQTWNRYVYTLNNPYKYVDPDGREVLWASRKVWWSAYRHSALVVIPDDQSRDWGKLGLVRDHQGKWYGTLSGFGEDYNLLKGGTLVGRMNDPSDDPAKMKSDARVANPFGQKISDDTMLIEQLIQANKNYRNNLRYEAFPEQSDDSYNCNSYAGGLLGAVGANVPTISSPGYIFPSLEKPVQSETFGQKRRRP